jgi:hypothetical protein
VSVWSIATKRPEAVELPEELRLSLGAIAGVAREGLLAMCTTVGLAVRAR